MELEEERAGHEWKRVYAEADKLEAEAKKLRAEAGGLRAEMRRFRRSAIVDRAKSEAVPVLTVVCYVRLIGQPR